MSEIDYGAVFGIDTGANEPAPAQQDAGTTDAENTANTDTGSEAENDAGEKETEVAEQSAEENARQAAARRKRERDAAIEQARQEERQNAQRSLDEAIALLGQTNPYTGKAVTTKAEWDEWKAQEAKEKSKEVAESAGMSATEFDNFINNLPIVRNAQQAVAEASKEKQRVLLDQQLTEIGKLDPSIKTVDDLRKRPEYPQIYASVQRGNSIVDAFKLANFDVLTQQRAEASRQAALNSANSKEHMAPTQTRGSGAITVPNDVKEMYRIFNPKATDAEIQAHYNKLHKN